MLRRGVERSNKAGCWIFHLDFIWKVQSWSTKGKFGVDAAGMHPPDDFIEKLNSLLSSSSSTQHAQDGQVCPFFWQLEVESFMIWFSKWKQKTGIFFLSPNLKISKFPPTRVSFLPLIADSGRNDFQSPTSQSCCHQYQYQDGNYYWLLCQAQFCISFSLWFLFLREECVDKSLLLDFPKLMQLITFPTRPPPRLDVMTKNYFAPSSHLNLNSMEDVLGLPTRPPNWSYITHFW